MPRKSTRFLVTSRELRERVQEAMDTLGAGVSTGELDANPRTVYRVLGREQGDSVNVASVARLLTSLDRLADELGVREHVRVSPDDIAALGGDNVRVAVEMRRLALREEHGGYTEAYLRSMRPRKR